MKPLYDKLQRHSVGKQRVWQTEDNVKKAKNAVVCADCGVVFQDGRWQWLEETPVGATEGVCPACQQVRESAPVGVLTLRGAYFNAHKDEILSLVRHRAIDEENRRPLNRLIAIEEFPDRVELHFTDRHLPHSIGAAIQHAHAGELSSQFQEDVARAIWLRK